MPLDDANTTYASQYHLLQAKTGLRIPFAKVAICPFLGVDNLLNEKYSLGNDINALGGRFFNPAPPRNFYGGVNVLFGL